MIYPLVRRSDHLSSDSLLLSVFWYWKKSVPLLKFSSDSGFLGTRKREIMLTLPWLGAVQAVVVSWATNECGVNCLDAECSPLQFSDFNHLSKSPLVKIVVQPLHFFPIHVWSIIHGVSKGVGRTVSSLSLIDTSQIQFWKHSIFLLYRGSLV